MNRRTMVRQAWLCLSAGLGLGACSVDYQTLRGIRAGDAGPDLRSDAADVPGERPPLPADGGPDAPVGLDAPADLPPVEVLPPADGPARDTGLPFAYRKAITVQRSKVGEPSTTRLTSYPVLLVLEDPDLRTAASGGKVQSLDGADIAFVATAAETCVPAAAPCLLDYELERYLPATGTFIAWVAVPALNGPAAATDTVFYLVYGAAGVNAAPAAAARVWDDGFTGVWHFAETADDLPAIQDSTARANHGSAKAAVMAGVAGRVGAALELDGMGGHVEVADADTLDLGATGTVSLWYRADVPGVWRGLVSKGPQLNGAGETVNYAIELDLTDKLAWYLGNGIRDFASYSGPHPHTPEFHHIAMVWEAGMLHRYLDGAPLGPALPIPLTPIPNAIPLRFGVYSSELKDPLDGALDEIRLSRVARSPAWIATDHQNQSAPAAFYRVGPEETPPRSLITFERAAGRPPTATSTSGASGPGRPGRRRPGPGSDPLPAR